MSNDSSPKAAPTAEPTVIGALALTDVLTKMAASRPVFHSEADFQHHLAWTLREMDPQVRVRLETRPLAGERLHLDLLLTRPASAERVAVELKYPTRSLNLDHQGERFELRDHAALDATRHDVVKDIQRLERLVAAGAADSGWMLALSNDPGCWNAPTRDTFDIAFRIHEGRDLAGRLEWAPGTGSSTKAGRDLPLELTGRYTLAWRPYSTVSSRSAGTFRVLAVQVGACASALADRPSDARPDDPIDLTTEAAQPGTPEEMTE